MRSPRRNRHRPRLLYLSSQKPALVPVAVDPEAEKQKEMLAKSQQAYEAMSDTQKAGRRSDSQQVRNDGDLGTRREGTDLTFIGFVRILRFVIKGLEK
jgi:hypothetical protein